MRLPSLFLAAASLGLVTPLHAQLAAEAPTTLAGPVEQPDARAVVEALAAEMEASFVFPDVAKRYAAALRAKLAAGGYDHFANASAFADAVTGDLQAVSPDKHLKLFTPDMIAKFRGKARRPDGAAETFIEKSGWIAPGVAYISFTMFSGSDQQLSDFKQFLAAHADAKTLVIDVRKHRGGGMDEMDLLFAQLFAKPTDLLELDTRAAVDSRDSDGTEDGPTLFKVAGPEGVVRRLHRAVPAAQASGLRSARVFVLTSSRSASAAEHLALALKRTGRATLVGEKTRGAGNYGQPFPLPGGYAAFIPYGRTFDPQTGEGWEGTGVKPDVAVPADQALDEVLKLVGVKATSEVALAKLR